MSGNGKTFPSAVGQTLTYEMDGSTATWTVTEKTTYRGHEVFKVYVDASNVPDFGALNGTVYVDDSGRVWKLEAEGLWIEYNHDKGEYSTSVTGEAGTMSDLFVPVSQLSVGAWWKHQNLSPGEDLNIYSGVTPEDSSNFNFSVLRTETVTVPAGSFETYVVQSKTGVETNTFWIDKDTGILVKMETSMQTLQLKDMEGF